MTAPHLPPFIEQRTVGRDRLPALPQPQVETYLTGRFTELNILQTSTEDSRWDHYAEVATTTREWVPILTTALEHHDEAKTPKVPVELLRQHDEPGAPNAPAEVLGQYDEPGAPNVPAEVLGQHDASGAPNVPAELHINGVVYHRSSYDRNGEEQG